MWNCFVGCLSAAAAAAIFLSASDIDTVIMVNYDHSVCLDPITIIISIIRQREASIRQRSGDHPKFKTGFGQTAADVLFCQSAPPPPPNERSHQKQ